MCLVCDYVCGTLYGAFYGSPSQDGNVSFHFAGQNGIGNLESILLKHISQQETHIARQEKHISQQEASMKHLVTRIHFLEKTTVANHSLLRQLQEKVSELTCEDAQTSDLDTQPSDPDMQPDDNSSLSVQLLSEEEPSELESEESYDMQYHTSRSESAVAASLPATPLSSFFMKPQSAPPLVHVRRALPAPSNRNAPPEPFPGCYVIPPLGHVRRALPEPSSNRNTPPTPLPGGYVIPVSPPLGQAPTGGCVVPTSPPLGHVRRALPYLPANGNVPASNGSVSKHLPAARPLSGHTRKGPSRDREYVGPRKVTPGTVSSSARPSEVPHRSPPVVHPVKHPKGAVTLPSSRIDKSQLWPIQDVVRNFSNNPSYLARKLATFAFYGSEVLSMCTPKGKGSFPALPLAELNMIKQVVFDAFPQYWDDPDEYERLWNSNILPAIGTECSNSRRAFT